MYFNLSEKASASLEKPFIRMEEVTIRMGNRLLFENTTWTIANNEHWAITGPNGSGKSIFIQALCGKIPVSHGHIHYYFNPAVPEKSPYRTFPKKGEIIVISPDSHRGMMNRYSSYHQARWQSFEGKDAPTVRALLSGESSDPSFSDCEAALSTEEKTGNILHIIELLGIGHLLERRMIHLSHGESRKVQIAMALIRTPKLIVFDDLFVGMDRDACHMMKQVIENLLAIGSPRLLLAGAGINHLPEGFTHILALENNRIRYRGDRTRVLPAITGQEKQECRAVGFKVNRSPDASPPGEMPIGVPEKNPAVLVDFKDVSVSYAGIQVLESISWKMKESENWAILGPNGSGKTTLLSLVLADNPQSYANDISLFGRKRGTGESIWDIKNNIGWVSPELQIYHPTDIAGFDLVCSGFFHSIGLYRKCTSDQQDVAMQWIRVLGLEEISPRAFYRMSSGEQRLFLLCRALVKYPRLLVLDEPCQGLDAANQNRFLNAVDHLCSPSSSIRMIFTTHDPDALPSAISHVLTLEKGRIRQIGTRKQMLGAEIRT